MTSLDPDPPISVTDLQDANKNVFFLKSHIIVGNETRFFLLFLHDDRRIRIHTSVQDFGSGSVLDPYSIGPLDPDPNSESGSRILIRIGLQPQPLDPDP